MAFRKHVLEAIQNGLEGEWNVRGFPECSISKLLSFALDRQSASILGSFFNAGKKPSGTHDGEMTTFPFGNDEMACTDKLLCFFTTDSKASYLYYSLD